MSRKLFAFLLSELKTVRVICKHDQCGVVTELPISQLYSHFSGNLVACPHCRQPLVAAVQNRQDWTVFSLLEAAWHEASKPKAMFDIEFVLPDLATSGVS